jgi:uncharacterized protein DUF1996
MLRTKFHSHIVLIITLLMTQVSIAFAAPASQTRAGVQPELALAGSTGWIVSCNYSHSLSDDPIVFPGQPGASHLHDFVGATTTDRSSTATSLQTGGTTCAVSADKSAYWVPALYKNGTRVLPKATSKNALFYYRRKGAPSGTMVQPFPRGLKMIIGNAKATSPQENPQLGTDIIFKCGPGSGTDLPAPPKQCASGILVLSLRFPNCWDGVHLDSADHKSHMAYPSSGRCPKTHPVVLPRLESFFRYNVGTAPLGTITLASGPYYTAHQDFFNAWDPAALQMLVTKCLNAETDCGTNPSVGGLRIAASLPTNTITPTFTITNTPLPTKTGTPMPTRTPTDMPTNIPPTATQTAVPLPTDTPMAPADTPTEVPTMVEPTQPGP